MTGHRQEDLAHQGQFVCGGATSIQPQVLKLYLMNGNVSRFRRRYARFGDTTALRRACHRESRLKYTSGYLLCPGNSH
jgi:hypothetical protein